MHWSVELAGMLVQLNVTLMPSILDLCYWEPIIGQSAKMLLEVPFARKMRLRVCSELTACFENQ